jgi:hypothetical protein
MNGNPTAAAAAVDAMMDQMSKAWIWKLHTGEATVKQLVNDLQATDPLTVRVRSHLMQDLVKMLSNPSTLPQPTFGIITSLLGELVARDAAKTGRLSDDGNTASAQQHMPLLQYSPVPYPNPGEFVDPYKACPPMEISAQNSGSPRHLRGRRIGGRGAGS